MNIFKVAGRWVLYNADSVDVLLNTFMGGKPRQPISARWGLLRGHVWLAYWGCYILDKIQPRHCETAAERYARIQEDLK